MNRAHYKVIHAEVFKMDLPNLRNNLELTNKQVHVIDKDTVVVVQENAKGGGQNAHWLDFYTCDLEEYDPLQLGGIDLGCKPKFKVDILSNSIKIDKILVFGGRVLIVSRSLSGFHGLVFHSVDAITGSFVVNGIPDFTMA